MVKKISDQSIQYVNTFLAIYDLESMKNRSSQYGAVSPGRAGLANTDAVHIQTVNDDKNDNEEEIIDIEGEPITVQQ